MTESEYLQRSEQLLRAVEQAIDAADAGVDFVRSGGVLTLELENDTKIVVSTQMPARQIWVAARSGGFHFAFDGQRWHDTRDGAELFAALSKLLSSQGGRPMVLRGI